jgi:autotransporter-associated beta strand protein
MALRYFDRNGTSAGFGTLTGAWDTTTASWTTSSAGTATPAAFTFTAEDTAQFGATGTTGTPGTATISTGITVTLNKIVCQNLPANTMTVAHAGTGKLSLAKNAALNVPTFQCDSSLNWNAATDGSDGFLKSGSGSLVLTTNTKGVSGAVTVEAGYIVYGVFLVGSNNWLPNVTSYAVNNTDAGGLFFQALDAYTLSVPFTGPATRSNNAGIYSYSANGITLSDTASVAAFKGFLAVYAGNTTNYQGQFVLSAFPAELNMFRFNTATTSTTARTNAITINGTGGTCAAAVELYATASGTATVHSLVDNSTSASTFSGGAFLNASSNASATQTLRLSGSNTAGSAFTGVIDQAASRGVIALDKAGAGNWSLSGANTYTGTTVISAGTLSAQNASALGRDSSLSGGAISVTGGTLELAGGVIVDKSGLNISTVTTASPTNAFQVPASGGDNTLEVGSITLNSTILVDVGSSAALRFANTGAITGSTFGITKNGTGELDMGATANSFTGAVTFNAGTLTVAASCAPSTNGPLGNSTSTVTVPGTGTLKFDGASNANISRSVQLTGSTPALDASGTHHVHFSNVSQASGSRTLTLRGTSTATNQLQSALGNGSGGTLSLTKEGAGQWLITGTPTYTGATTVNAGTLDFGGQTLSLSGGVAMAGGTLANGNIGDTLVSAVTFTGGAVIALLDSTSTVTATSGTGRLQPLTADGSNTYTGNTTVQSGATLELVTDANPGVVGDGKVTGASNVTVSGTLATGNGVNQRGQCRYGGNLTFAAGSVLAIGAAA